MSNLKIIVFENCKEGTYEYYVGSEKDIMKIFRTNIDEEVWKIVSDQVHQYFAIDPTDTEYEPEEIEYWMLEKANVGYVEEHDFAIYCDEPITVVLPKRADGESALKDFTHEKKF